MRNATSVNETVNSECSDAAAFRQSSNSSQKSQTPLTSKTTEPESTSTAKTNSSPVVLRASGLKKSFGGQVVLNGVDLELRRGEVVLLEGENGAGKTTLLNILTGNLEADAGTIRYSANSQPTEYRFPRSWFQSFKLFNRFAPDTVARHGFGRTWQDVRLFQSLSLHDNIAVGQQNQRSENPFFALLGLGTNCVAEGHQPSGSSVTQPTVRPSKEADELPYKSHVRSASTPDQLLAQLGLSGREQSSGDMISLGQSKRVAIARAIAAGATVLFLDEPLAGLDSNGIGEVVGMLSTLVADHEITIIIIEHVFNQTHLRDLVTTRWHLGNGQIAIGLPKEADSNQCTEQPHWFQFLSAAAHEIITESLPRGATLTRFRIKGRNSSNPALQLQDLVVKRGVRTVIGLNDLGNETGFNLVVETGEIAVLQAPNGWGKSTLLDSVAGVLDVRAGDTKLDSRSLHDCSIPERYRLGITYLKAPASGFDSMTMSDLVRLGDVYKGDLPENTTFSQLSGGQKQRVMFPDMNSARCFILDEPFNAMDKESIDLMCQKILSSKATILIAVPTISVA